MKCSLLVVLALSTIACAPRISAVSTPPPTRQAEQVHRFLEDDVVHVARGVAIAFDCHEGFFPESCRNAAAKTDNKEVAKVFPAYLKRQPDPYRGDPGIRPRTGFVLAGVAPGKTLLTIESSQGVQTLTVIVD